MQVPLIAITGDDLTIMRKLIKVHAIIQFDTIITEREADVLSEYVIYGCNKQGDDAIQLNYGISTNNIKQLGSRLQKKGMLVSKKRKDVGRDLHPFLVKMRELFLEKENKHLLIQVWK
jgi:hypothetical protein